VHPYNQVYAVNFLQPVGTIPGDSARRNPVRVQFTINAFGGQTQAFIASEFAFLPMQQ